MKVSIKRHAVALAAIGLGVFGNLGSALAQTYGAQELDQSRILLVSAPGSRLRPHQLFIIEQIRDNRPCFEITGTNPGEVNPLWTTFDFSGICGRASDTNGYSIRVANEDLGIRYRLQIQESGGELLLLGVPSDGTSPLQIGRTGGVSSTGFTQIIMNPGWRVTKRTYQGQTLGHNYLTNEATLAQILEQGGDVVIAPPTTPTPPPTEPVVNLPFPDIRGDVYATQIARAVEIGVVSGFQDGTFKPREQVTREQAVSMVVEALVSKQTTLSVPTQTSQAPFPDVPANRWSAAKIAFAKTTGIVSGDQTGTFRPSASVTRVELMAMLRRTAEYERTLIGLQPTLEPTHEALNFTDVSGHWGEDLIRLMSGYCQVATPLNEAGNAFHPNTPALRNYASAALVRLYDCGQAEQAP
nr:DUF3747 domain-containing protein [Cyanobacteriota bacterium]MDA0864852.1 DUF3747 domain-containing protein [Cyanobacteriota bacterium]